MEMLGIWLRHELNSLPTPARSYPVDVAASINGAQNRRPAVPLSVHEGPPSEAERWSWRFEMRTFQDLGFGRHKGLTLPQLLFEDPDWFFWACGRKNFWKAPVLAAEAEEIYWRATRVAIPPSPNCGPRVVEYQIHQPTGKLGRVILTSPDLVPIDERGCVERSGWLDLSFARQLRSYDKYGSEILVRFLKKIYFGNPSSPITKGRAATFFADDNNFVPPGVPAPPLYPGDREDAAANDLCSDEGWQDGDVDPW